MKKKNHSNKKLETITFKTLVAEVDIAKHSQWARFVDCRGIEYGRPLRFENNKNGFYIILTRIYEICKQEYFKKIIIGMKSQVITGKHLQIFC